jgi:hypothetical protein
MISWLSTARKGVSAKTWSGKYPSPNHKYSSSRLNSHKSHSPPARRTSPKPTKKVLERSRISSKNTKISPVCSTESNSKFLKITTLRSWLSMQRSKTWNQLIPASLFPTTMAISSISCNCFQQLRCNTLLYAETQNKRQLKSEISKEQWKTRKKLTFS